jgi:hypothetical protein
MIGDATFDYSVRGDILALTPIIKANQRREVLRRPWEFSTAGWTVAVSYPGTKWNRVVCQGWCQSSRLTFQTACPRVEPAQWANRTSSTPQPERARRA